MVYYWFHGTSRHCHFRRFQGIQQNSISNNAVLVVAGDLKVTKKWIEKYFGQSKGEKIKNKLSSKNQ
jgi:predicted Zn-dependent peptidase